MLIFKTVERDYTQLKQDFKAQNRMRDQEWPVFFEIGKIFGLITGCEPMSLT